MEKLKENTGNGEEKMSEQSQEFDKQLRDEINQPISNNNSQDDQIILKSVFNRGVKEGKPETAEDLIGSCNKKIKINVKPLQPKKTVMKEYSKSPNWIRQFFKDRQNQENHF